MYTPTEEGPTPIAGERPFAGWLGASIGLTGISEKGWRSLELEVGLTGPASLARESQEALHAMVPGFRRPVGWEHQLSNELAMSIGYVHGWDRRVGSSDAWSAALSPSVSATAGTLRSALSTTVSLRAGRRVADRTGKTSGAVGFSGFVRLGGELVANDLFLNGNTFQPSVRAPLVPAQATIEWGAALRLSRMELEHRITTRTREYDGGPATHTFGRISLVLTR